MRKSERLRVTMIAKCKAPDGDDSDVVIVNFTQEGCCIDLNGTAAQVGQPTLVRLESGDALTGTVRWVKNGKAGLEFDHPVSRQRVEYLRREHSTFLSESEWPDKPVQRSVC
ncbi:MAG: PilZ domain-containing protein [Novosphingobium sp.]